MPNELTGRKIAFLATDGVEFSELSEPWKAVTAAGATAELISIKRGEVHGKHADTEKMPVDRLVQDVTADGYDGLVLPGGVKNPDQLRMDRSAVAFVRAFFDAGKPVGAICHGPWMLVEADVLRGRTITSYPSLRTDIRNAGGTWVDEEVHVDRGLVTSRTPDDLPAFCRKLVEELGEGIHDRGATVAQPAGAGMTSR
jgi:protease I